MNKAAGALATAIEVMKGSGELFLTEDARRGIYDLLCTAYEEVSFAARAEES